MISEIKRAALIWDVNEHFLRAALQQDLRLKKRMIPFGFAVKKEGKTQHDYHIEDYQLRLYIGEEKWQAGLDRVTNYIKKNKQ